MKCTLCRAQVNGNFHLYCGTTIETEMQKDEFNTNKTKKPFYKKCWFWVIAVIVVLSMIGKFESSNKSNNEQKMSIDLTAPYEKQEGNNSENVSENQQTQNETEHTAQHEAFSYADDEVINRFISAFNNTAKYEMDNIKKGNIKTKYFASANNCYIEIINVNDAYADCFSIKINGGQEIADRDRMFDVFAETLKVLDPLLTDNTISEAVEHLKSEQYMVNDYKISDTVTVENYVPIVELSYGKSSCRIDVISSNFR